MQMQYMLEDDFGQTRAKMSSGSSSADLTIVLEKR